MSDPRLCIVGAGSLSTRRIYPNIGAAGARLVGICDLDTAKAGRNASLFGGKSYGDVDAMLAEEKPDGVIICIGPDQHAQVAKRVLQLGYPVYTEKPPAPSAADTLAVARLAKEKNLLCTTAFKKRYTTVADRVKQWLGKYSPEEFYSISIDYCSGQYPNDKHHRTFLFDFGVHVIDLVQYYFGTVNEVFAFTKGMDAYAVSLKFECGAVGSMNLNCGRSFQVPTEEMEITVRGGNFMTIHNSSHWKITENGIPTEWREPPTFASSGDSGRDTGHLAELEDFVNAIKEKRATTRSNIYESYKTMVLYEAIRSSAETQQVVRVISESL